jgi:hypothetical protein
MAWGWIYIIHQPIILRDCVKMGKTQNKRKLKKRYTTYYPKCTIYTWMVKDCNQAEDILFALSAKWRIYKKHELFRLPIQDAIEKCEETQRLIGIFA